MDGQDQERAPANLQFAYHEAGHAVFNFLHGCSIRRVTLDLTESTDQLSDRDRIMSLCAGAVGADLCPTYDENLITWYEDAQGSDMRESLRREYERLCPDSDPDDAIQAETWEGAYSKSLYAETRAFLASDSHKRAVAMLASELAKRGQIDGPEAEAIIRAALDSGHLQEGHAHSGDTG